DHGANTLGNLARSYFQKANRPLALPNLTRLGLGNITPMDEIPPIATGKGEGAFGRAIELSRGKDTSSGHWEFAGLVVSKPFVTYPDGFPVELINRWIKENDLPGILGNKAASGTEIIKELGAEHVATGKPILYTSADSVWQVAAHEESFGLDRLYKICLSARKLCDEIQLGRVIARPFVGNPAQGEPFKRTYNRKDYALPPFAPTYLDQLSEKQIHVRGIGKISNIYAAQGITSNIDTHGNTDGIREVIAQLDTFKAGLLYCNLIDFDMLFGHRRDVEGFATSLEEFDRALPKIKSKMTPRDLLILCSDHGNDPTFPGTDHTREHSLILAYSPAQNIPAPNDLGTRGSFADLGATVVHALTGVTPDDGIGKSFLPEMGL
ncbi:phosphopentomutase, partial [Bdellovibrionota bacterium FG-2]